MTGIYIARGRIEKLKPKTTRGARKLRVRVVVEPIVFEYAYQGRAMRVTLGVGAQLDGASAHWLARAVIDLLTGGDAMRAFALHDMLCQCRDIAKAEVDFVLNEAMKAGRFPGWLRRWIYAAVRGNASRNNWAQPSLTAILRTDGLPGGYVECPVEVIARRSA